MRIISITLENYGAYYGRHDFLVADRGLVLVQGENLDEPRMDSNGSAKSTLFEAIDWALFGVVPKGDFADSVIHDEANKCSVGVVVEDDTGSIALVERRRPSSLLFEIDGKDQTTLDPKETQTAVNAWLGLNREVFHAAVFFGQDDLRRFADSTDAQRMEILGRVIPELAEVDVLLDRAKDSRRTQKPILLAAKATAETLANELAAIEKIDYSKQIEAWEADRAKWIAEVEANIDCCKKALEQATVGAQTLPALDQLVARLEAEARIEIKTTVAGLDDVVVALAASREQYASVHGAKSQLERQLIGIQNTGEGRCPTCGSVVTANHLAFETHRLTSEIWGLSQQLGSIGQQGQQLAERERDLRKALSEQTAEAKRVREERLQDLAVALGKQAQAKQDLARMRELSHQIDALLKQREQVASSENIYRARQQEAQARMTQLRVDWRIAKSREEKASGALAAIDFWVDAFGPCGIKSLILDTKLQELTDAANEWVMLLTGGTMWIRFESQRMGRSTKTLRNAPNIRVFRYHRDGRVTERNYRGWSGGERQRISWAVDFGLSRLIARRATKKWDLLILDEVFKHVDAKGGEAVVEMLTRLQQEKSSIFVIEHDNEFKSHFGTVITARKARGRSCIIEDANEGERQTWIQSGRDGEAGVDGQAKCKKGKKRKAGDRGLPVVATVR